MRIRDYTNLIIRQEMLEEIGDWCEPFGITNAELEEKYAWELCLVCELPLDDQNDPLCIKCQIEK